MHLICIRVESILKNKETGEVLDRYYTPTGIRTFRFDAQKRIYPEW